MEKLKLQRIKDFDSKFEKIENINYYPFVGEDFVKCKKKIMVFAHNIPVKEIDFDKTSIEKSSPTHFTSELRQYVNTRAQWTTSFRNFIKGSLSYKKDYKIPVNFEIDGEIENFINKISHINFINGLVSSNSQNNAKIDSVLISNSIEVNNQILDILDITHVVCWGKNVFNYIVNQKNIEVLESWDNFDKIEGLTKSKGYGYAKINLNGKIIHILKTFHPSMPSFRQYYDNTHNIFNWFYNL
jgi:hypothetical protein